MNSRSRLTCRREPMTTLDPLPMDKTLNASRWDAALAAVCANCPVCRRARQRQRGLAFRLVKTVESKSCPFCRAYERVYGRKPHEPVPDAVDAKS